MRQRRQRGATLVEAAFVLLLLITIVFAVLDFGRAYNVYQIMTNAAREGARYGVAPAQGTATIPTTDAVKARVQALLTASTVKGSTVNVTRVTQSVNSISLSYTQVDVTADYESFFLPSLNVTLKTQARMRNENN